MYILSNVYMDMDFITSIYVAVPLMIIFGQHNTESAEYCVYETFVAKCKHSEIILIQSANYGRKYTGKCITGDEDSIGCYGDVIREMDRECTGRTECSYRVSTLEQYVEGCYKGDRLRFLDVQYTCISVDTQSDCNTSTNGTEGYLQGLTTTTTITTTNTSGTQDCPWILSTLPGQQFQINLIDISLQSALLGLRSPQAATNTPCPVILVVAEPGRGSVELPLCHYSNDREVGLYVSKGNGIQMYIVLHNIIKNIKQDVIYLIYYKGCADTAPPMNTWLQREDDRLTVKCNNTGETWYLVCKDTSWFGELGNCTELTKTTTAAPQNQEESGFPWNIVTAVAIGIAIGVFVGLSMLGIVVAVIRCRDKKKNKPQTQTPDLSKIDVPYTTQQQQQQRSLYESGPSHASSHPADIPYGQQHNIGRSASYHQTRFKRPLPDPHDPHYHIYGYNSQNKQKQWRTRSLERQSTHTTDADEHIYETAYMTRPQLLGQDSEKDLRQKSLTAEMRQKSLAKEYYEMRETPEGTLEKQHVQPSKY